MNIVQLVNQHQAYEKALREISGAIVAYQNDPDSTQTELELLGEIEKIVERVYFELRLADSDGSAD